MSHVLEAATTGRSKCRGCRVAIAKGTLRVGERAPNPFGEGEAVYWFHPACAALKRPHVIVELAEAADAEEKGALSSPGDSPKASPEATVEQEPESRPQPEVDPRWLGWARRAADHERLARIGAPGQAPSGRARCRQCRELIAKLSWRVALDIWEEGRFAPLGFVHAVCLGAYCRLESPGDLVERVLHGAELSAEDAAAVTEALAAMTPVADESGD